MPEKDLKEPIEGTPETSLAKDGTPTAQPVPKEDDPASKAPLAQKLQKVKNIVDKHG